MKPYRGVFLAAAILLTTLPLFGCGDADDYSETEAITLTASEDSIPVGRVVGFTVQTTTPENQYECETTIEYQAKGAGMNQPWLQVPGTETARIFGLKPPKVGLLSVIARAKCVGAKEDWHYSEQVDVTVAEPTQLTIDLTANPTSVAVGNPVTFTLVANSPANDCSIRLMYEYSGAGFAGVTKVDPASAGQFILTPPGVGTLVVTAKGWCGANPDEVLLKTVNVTVTAATLPTATVTLTGPTAYSIAGGGGTGFIYSISGTPGTGCTLKLRYQVLPGGTLAGAVDIQTPVLTPGPQALIDPSAVGSITVIGSAWCTQNTSAVATQTATVTVGL